MKYKTLIFDTSKDNVFFISDTHFMHKNIIDYCNRPFKDVDEMNSVLIENWNFIVNPDDYVIHGGDFCLGSKSSWAYLLDKLNGKKYLTAGNHDTNITPDKFIDVQHRFNIRIIDDEELTSDGQRITVDHYPFLSWYQSHRGSIQLYGHVHGGLVGSNKTTPNQLDIGVDVHNFTPLSYRDVMRIITKQNLEKQ